MRFVLFTVAIISLFSYMVGKTVFIKNSLTEINNSEGKVNLTLVRIWGGDEIDDENQFFRFPQDVKISRDGLIYIADSMNNRIQVFERNGNFKRTIGRKGQGPGDIREPMSIDIDKNNNLIVVDSGNIRVQTFDSRGNYLSSFRFDNKRPTDIAINQKNEIVLYSFEKSFISNSLLYILDYRGNILRKIGKNPIKSKSIFENESIFFTLDRDDNIFIAFYCTPYYHKYSSSGESLLVVTFEIPFKGPTVHMDNNQQDKYKNEPRISGKKKMKISSGIALDHMNKVYIITATRPPHEKEKFFIGSGGRRYPKKIESTSTDRYRLLVFDHSGKITAAKRLSVFCDKFYVHEDSLFIIDSYMAMKIYEYKISFN